MDILEDCFGGQIFICEQKKRLFPILVISAIDSGTFSPRAHNEKRWVTKDGKVNNNNIQGTNQPLTQ